MAGLGRKTFTAGEVLTAANVNGFLMDQSVMVFADAAARTTAIPTPTEGMVTYLEDTNALEVFTGAAFVPVAEEVDLTTLIPKSTVTTAGDLIIADGASSVTRLSLGTTGQILESNGTALSYVTPDASPDDIITTQGDLIIGDATANAARIAIGAADTVLTSNGTTATWEEAGGGGTTDWTRLVNAVPWPTGSTTASVSFTTGYDKYAIYFQGISSTATATVYLSMLNSSNNAMTVDRAIYMDPQGGDDAEIRVDTSTSNELFAAYLGNAGHVVNGAIFLSGGTGGIMHGHYIIGIGTNNLVNFHSMGQVFFNGGTPPLGKIQLRVDSGNFDGTGTTTVYGA